MAADSAVDAAKEGVETTKNAVSGALGWTFNQLHPIGANGRLGRTLMIGTALGAVGIASGGIAALPNIAAAAAASSTGTLTAGTAATAASSELTVLGAGSDFLHAAWEGAGTIASGGKNIIGGADWGGVVDAAKAGGQALTQNISP